MDMAYIGAYPLLTLARQYSLPYSVILAVAEWPLLTDPRDERRYEPQYQTFENWAFHNRDKAAEVLFSIKMARKHFLEIRHGMRDMNGEVLPHHPSRNIRADDLPSFPIKLEN